LKVRLKKVRKEGFVVADAEYKPDLCVIAVPIRDHHGKVHAALMTGIQSERVRRNKSLLGTIVQILKREALVISHAIGYQGPDI
jgi:DNA-binding IclR family transcriptional regulator